MTTSSVDKEEEEESNQDSSVVSLDESDLVYIIIIIVLLCGCFVCGVALFLYFYTKKMKSDVAASVSVNLNSNDTTMEMGKLAPLRSATGSRHGAVDSVDIISTDGIATGEEYDHDDDGNDNDNDNEDLYHANDGNNKETGITGGVKHKGVANWDVDQVCQWLENECFANMKSSKIGEVMNKFKEQDITGQVLLQMKKNKNVRNSVIKAIGVESVGIWVMFDAQLAQL